MPKAIQTVAGTERGQWALRESLIRYAVGRGVLVDREGRLIAGNKQVYLCL